MTRLKDKCSWDMLKVIELGRITFTYQTRWIRCVLFREGTILCGTSDPCCWILAPHKHTRLRRLQWPCVPREAGHQLASIYKWWWGWLLLEALSELAKLSSWGIQHNAFSFTWVAQSLDVHLQVSASRTAWLSSFPLAFRESRWGLVWKHLLEYFWSMCPTHAQDLLMVSLYVLGTCFFLMKIFLLVVHHASAP